jgi:hypothetical protein
LLAFKWDDIDNKTKLNCCCCCSIWRSCWTEGGWLSSLHCRGRRPYYPMANLACLKTASLFSFLQPNVNVKLFFPRDIFFYTRERDKIVFFF